MTTVERVARAIWAEGKGQEPWSDVGERAMMRIARAAITALREPTEGMIAAACSASVLPDEASDEELALDYWHAIIDGILAEQPQGQQAV